MKHTFKALFIGGILFFLTTFSDFKLSAQNYTSPEFVGTWVLDSVQVKEVMQDNVIQKTVLPAEDSNFSNNWMRQFTLNAEGKASYTGTGNFTISDVPYFIKDKNETIATLIIDGVPDYKILKVQLLSDSTMALSHSFNSVYNSQDIDVFWKMYYHKSHK